MVWRVRILAILATLIVLVLGLILFWQSALLDIDEFQAEGNTETPIEFIIEASGLSKGDQLLNLDLKAAAESVRRLPWVKDVEIDRTWGGTIKFNIAERTPTAVAFSRHGYTLLDSTGRVLELLGTEKSCLGYANDFANVTCVANVVVLGEEGESVAMSQLPVFKLSQLLVETISDDSTGNITFESLTKRIVIDPETSHAFLELREGGWVYLANPNENLENKLVNALTLLTSGEIQDLGLNFCGDAIVDVRIVGDVTITPEDTC